MTENNGNRQRILFFAEAVTLAHVARPMVLAKALSAAGYEVHVACDPRYQALFDEPMVAWHAIDTLAGDRFLARMARGRALYRASELQQYVEEERQLIDAVQPDRIVGDFRLTLSVSARLAKVPYLAISNAYWSPYARQVYPRPELMLNRLVGNAVGGILFDLLHPVGFALHTLPLNRIRKRYGLPSLGWDLRRIYTDADHVLYADIPALIPTFDLPEHHHYIGPINWSPTVPLPDWWTQLPGERPLIYVTLGSSGQSERLPAVLEALAELPVTVVAATAGRISLPSVPANAWVADYLPGEAAAARASLVICNGGSPTTMQALSAGVPVLGIPSNLDQYLNMSYLQQAGVGSVVRAGEASPAAIRYMTTTMLEQEVWHRRAHEVAGQLAAYQPAQRLLTLLQKRLSEANEA